MSVNGLTCSLLKQFLINFNPPQKVSQKVTTERYLFTFELITETFIHLISEFPQTMCSL